MTPNTCDTSTQPEQFEALECALKIHNHLMDQLIRRPSQSLSRHVRNLQCHIEELELELNLTKITDSSGKPIHQMFEDADTP
ncbi:hypothetical protein [Marinoscillum furvescens]|nr:hypothetical protein [Marinoscillum furvescens]